MVMGIVWLLPLLGQICVEVKGDTLNDFNVEEGKSCTGHTHAVHDNVELEECVKLCEQYVCEGFVYLDNQTCTIKGKCVVVSANAMSYYGFRELRTHPRFHLHSDQECNSPSLKVTSFTSLYDCLTDCDQTENCVMALVYEAEFCHLKDASCNNSIDNHIGAHLYELNFHKYADLYCLEEMNVALGKPVNMSSVDRGIALYSTDAFYEASHCVSTKLGYTEFWEVDLFYHFDIFAVTIVVTELMSKGRNMLTLITSTSSTVTQGNFNYCVQVVSSLREGYNNFTCDRIQLDARYFAIKYLPISPLVQQLIELVEVEVIAYGVYNAAKDKVVLSSAFGVDASMVVDGDINVLSGLGSCLILPKQSFHYITVDLEQSLMVKEALVFLATHLASSFTPRHFFVTMSKFYGNLEGEEQFCSYDGNQTDLMRSVKCQVSGRYFVLYQRKDNESLALGVCEIAVTAECPFGTYGYLCNETCSENCGAFGCHKSTGLCAGGCAKGLYGLACDKACRGHCLDDICDFATGRKCTNGHCKPGYYLLPSCDFKCPLNCQGEVCDEVTGICKRCKPGYAGARCTYRCPDNCKEHTCNDSTGLCSCKDGFYGGLCEKECYKNCKDGICDQSSGVCTCIDGYFGYYCEQEYSPENCVGIIDTQRALCPRCKAGFWTVTCNSECPENCKDKYCDQSNGQCFSCEDGFYGLGCLQNCPQNCKDKFCERFDGDCSCEDGYHGRRCNETCSSDCWSGKCEQFTGYCLLTS